MRARALAVAATAAAVLSGLTVPAAVAGPSPEPRTRGEGATLKEQLQRHRPTGRLQVRFKDGVTAGQRAAALARVTERGHSAKVDRRIEALNASVVSVSDAAAVQAILRADSRVAYVEAESRYRAFAEPVSPELVETGANAAHTFPGNPNTGAGKTIAVLDSYVDTANVDLNGAGKVVTDADTTTNVPDQSNSSYYVQDFACTSAACPHGTAVATSAAAEADDVGMVGVAPDATIRSYNVFRRYVYRDTNTDEVIFEEVLSNSSDIAAGLLAVADDAAGDPSFVAANMSLGGPFDNRLIREAIDDLRAAAPQVVIVAAAGNDGGERANFPAGDPHVLSVGATGQIPTGSSCSSTPAATWTVASFSNRGDVDVVAPGRCVVGWYPPTDPETGAVSGPAVLTKIDGTSFAAPMVAGMVALLAASPTTPVTGDAARAALIASATGTPSVDVGTGKANVMSALSLAASGEAYTAVSVERGNQVASTVGRRQVEVLRVEPGATEPTIAPTPAVTAGFGTVTQVSSAAVAGLGRRYVTFAVPATAKTGTFALTATGGSGDPDDTVSVPMKMLDAGDNYEGLPAATGEATAVPLTYGSRSAYIRSAKLNSGTLSWTYTYNATSTLGADLYVWMPSENGGTADAADEPIGWMGQPDVGPYTDSLTIGDTPVPGLTFKQGRYLLGWLISSAADNSGSAANTKYQMKLTYAGPTATVTSPTVASSSSITGPFPVSWSGNTKASKWDVEWGYRTKKSTSWSVTNWAPWKTGTTSKSGTFGLGGVPTTIVPGRTYWFRVRSWDTLGNPSVSVLRSTAVPYDDRSGSIAYSTGSTAWTKVGVSDRWLKTATKTSAANARASMTTDASSFTIVGDRCTTCGSFKVYLDGVYKATVSTYRSSGTAVRQTLWSSGALSGGIKSRRVTIIVSGTAGRPKVVLDGIAALR